MSEANIYNRLAELELQYRLLDGRLTMMTRMCNNYANDRAELCRQLGEFGLTITPDNKIIRSSAQ